MNPLNYDSEEDPAMTQLARERIASQPGKVLFPTKTDTPGDREAASRSSDGRLDVKHCMAGSAYIGTNPARLFAAARCRPRSAGPMQIFVPGLSAAA
jgi:hypothetical protein